MDQHFNVWLYYNMLPLYNRQFRPSKATISQAILAIRLHTGVIKKKNFSASDGMNHSNRFVHWH